jgi:hypothetical protein
MVSMPRCGVPGKTGRVVRRIVVPKIVEQEERIEFARLAEPEGAVQPDAGALHSRARVNDAF